jgi:hypothetical protein
VTRADVITFLEQYVIGRTVASRPITTTTGNGTVVIRYGEQSLFSNLTRSSRGFAFDVTCVTIGQRFLRGVEDGSPTVADGTMDAVRTFRYEMTERASTGELLGFGRFVTSTSIESDPLAGTCFLIRMTVEDGRLDLTESQIGYGDRVDADGSRTPAASDGRYRFSVGEGRLIVEYRQATFDVDPRTLERAPSGDWFPIQVSEEFDPADPVPVPAPARTPPR